MSATKSVLITGAAGFIGRATVAALRDTGWKIIQGVRMVDGSSVSGTAHLDLADPSSILAFAKEQRCDAIIHLGASVDLSGEADSGMFASNVLATGCLAYLANLWGAHLIYASTAIVHGARNEIISSTSPVCPDTPYAKSKWLGEQLIEASNARHCILRIAGVFGRAGPDHLGLNRAIAGVLKGEPPLQVGTGTALRSYVYVGDVARAIVYVLQEQMTGTHLLAGHEVISVSDMLRLACHTLAPGLHPVIKDGEEAINQVVTPSALLPRTRGFLDALIDIKEGRLR